MRDRVECRTGSSRVAIAITTVVGFALAAMTLACGGEDETRRDASADAVRKEINEAADVSARYVEDQRKNLQQRARQAGDEIRTALDETLDEAKAKLESGTTEGKAQLRKAMDRARRAQQDLDEEISELARGGQEQLESAGDRLSEALEEAQEAQRELGQALRGS